MNAQPQRAAPLPPDFYEFAAKRSELFTGNIPGAIRSLRSHRVYRWLRSHQSYRDAERALVKLPAFKSQVSPPGAPAGKSFPNDWELLYFASLVAQGLGEYYQACMNPARERVITGKDYKTAHRAAGVLLELICKGLEIGGEPGTISALYGLLERVPPTPPRLAVASRRSGKRVPVVTLARVLGQLIEGHYEVRMTPVIQKLVQVVEPEVDQRTVRRHLESVRLSQRTVNGEKRRP